MSSTMLRSFAIEAALLAGGLAVGVFAFARPARHDRREAEMELRIVQERVAAGQERLGELPMLTTRLRDLGLEVSALEARFGETRSCTAVSRELRRAARDRNLFLVLGGTWSRATEVEGPEEYRKELAVVGEFEDVVRFLEFVESRSYRLGIRDLTVRGAGDDDVFARFELILREGGPGTKDDATRDDAKESRA